LDCATAPGRRDYLNRGRADADVVRSGGLDVRGARRCRCDGHTGKRRRRLGDVIERDVTSAVGERQRAWCAGPGAVHGVGDGQLSGCVVLREPPNEEVTHGDRPRELHRGGRHTRAGVDDAALVEQGVDDGCGALGGHGDHHSGDPDR